MDNKDCGSSYNFMFNDNMFRGNDESDLNLPIHEVSVLDEQTKILAEIIHSPSADKQRNVKQLTQMRNQVESENRQLEKRVKLIKKEEQVVLDKILSGMLHEKKLNLVKKEDERLRTTFHSLKQKEMEQTMVKRQKIVELKQQAQQMRKEKSDRLLSIKKENYLNASEMKKEALCQKRSIQIKNLNFYSMSAQPKLKFKIDLAENIKYIQERKANEHLDQLAREEAERLRVAKRQNRPSSESNIRLMMHY